MRNGNPAHSAGDLPKVTLAAARAAGALIVDDWSTLSSDDFRRCRLVVQRGVGADRGTGLVLKDSEGALCAPRGQSALIATDKSWRPSDSDGAL